MIYRKCPKCGHERTPADTAPEGECPACGLIFSKYLKQRLAEYSGTPAQPGDAADSGSALLARTKELLLHVPDEVDALSVYARAALLAALVVYGAKIAAMDVPSWEAASSLIHLPMVPIHEFGHVLFMPFGEFLRLLGGSLVQAGLPLVFGAIFLARRDPFAAAVMLWWSAVAVIDIAPYVYDAQQPQHVLLTGRTGETGAHDFIDVLGDLGLLKRAQSVGYGVHRFGILMLAVSFVWAAIVVWMQWRRRAK